MATSVANQPNSSLVLAFFFCRLYVCIFILRECHYAEIFDTFRLLSWQFIHSRIMAHRILVLWISSYKTSTEYGTPEIGKRESDRLNERAGEQTNEIDLLRSLYIQRM